MGSEMCIRDRFFLVLHLTISQSHNLAEAQQEATARTHTFFAKARREAERRKVNLLHTAVVRGKAPPPRRPLCPSDSWKGIQKPHHTVTPSKRKTSQAHIAPNTPQKKNRHSPFQEIAVFHTYDNSSGISDSDNSEGEHDFIKPN